jgi:hypothetical protein
MNKTLIPNEPWCYRRCFCVTLARSRRADQATLACAAPFSGAAIADRAAKSWILWLSPD